jgi:hypothetical protein
LVEVLDRPKERHVVEGTKDRKLVRVEEYLQCLKEVRHNSSKEFLNAVSKIKTQKP